MTDWNVVLVVTDSLRADHAYDGDLMPNLNTFAEDYAIRYKRAYTTAPWTLAANHAILWGRHPNWIGVEDHTKMSTKESISRHRLMSPKRDWATEGWIPKVLQDKGYFTTQKTGGGFVSGCFGFDRGFHASSQYPWVYMDVDDLVETIEVAAQSDRPFFVHSQDFDCHEPYGEWVRSADSREAVRFAHAEETPGFFTSANLPEKSYRDFSKSFYRNACIQYDEKLGELFGYLRRSGLLSSTIVIFTTDHGEELWDHGWGGHLLSVYEGVVRVPLLVHHPGFGAGESDDLVSHIDIAPTILDVDVRGSAQHLIFGKPKGRRNTVRCGVRFVESWEGVANPEVVTRNIRSKKCVITDTYQKLIATVNDCGEAVIEEYDLLADPGETTNIFKAENASKWLN